MADLLFLHDEDVLAVLDFIDNFESDIALDVPALPQPQPPLPSSPSPSETAAKRPRMHSGQRVRAEIQRLRASVAEMEARVQQLKLRPCSCDATTTAANNEVSSSAVLASRSWEDIAQRQKAQSQHAQHENARLRSMLVHQGRVARKLEHVVSRARRIEKTRRTIKRELLVERASSEPWPVSCDRLQVRTVS